MIGVISDTHDNIEAIRKAVELFNSREVEMVLHAGDLISPFTADEFMKLRPRFHAVFGNNEGEREGLRERFKGFCELTDFLEIDHDGKKICVYHGTVPYIVDALAVSRIYDLVVTGHTHNPEIKRINETLVVNPGECCGYLTGKKTVAFVDLGDMSAEIIRI